MSARATVGTEAGKRHERLKAWVACHELTLAVYQVTESWPKVEQYSLTAQVRRAAYAAAANIAEGSAKRGNREFRRFLDISLGSLSELCYLLRLGRDLGYLTSDRWGELEAIRDHAGRLTWGLYRAITRRAESPK
jgi:four helix bundle protein